MADQVIPEIILFEHPDFRGAHRHVFQAESDLAVTFPPGQAGTGGPAGGQFTNITSSFVVVTGTWELFDGTGFHGDKEVKGPGRYRNFEGMTIDPDTVSSVRPT